MLRVNQHLASASSAEIQEELCLPFDERKRGRLKATADSGREIGLFLQRGEVLRDGALLQAESGEVVRIKASQESVTTARCDDPLLFARACYHLGNRHVPLQIGNNWLRYQHDHVLDEMVSLLGLAVCHEQAPFEPENGAYHGHGHSHGHHHEH